MYKLYWAPGTAAMAPQTILEEAGAPYEPILLDVDARQHHRPEYKSINPTGFIPTLVDGDFVIFETAAICQYLCDKHPETKLMPPAGSQARGRAYQWLTYMTNTVQVGYIDWFHPERTFADAPSQAALKKQSEEKLKQSFAVLDGGIGGGKWMAGDQYGVCDIYLAMLTRWSRYLAEPMWLWPNIKRVVGSAYVRPAFQRMMAKQGIAWPERWPAA